MSNYNLASETSIEDSYNRGLLPQRNNRDLFYLDTSCRSDLANFALSSENRRIIRKTEEFSFEMRELTHFDFSLDVQKRIFNWIKTLGWSFPISSVKYIFCHHIFNYVYIWKNSNSEVVAYGIVYYSDKISHIAYVFYNPEYLQSNLPIRLVLQVTVDSAEKKLNYCYLGRFSKENGYYKRNMPGFEFYQNNTWQKV
jgi:hypothetical protein